MHFPFLSNGEFLQLLTERDIELRLQEQRLSINAPAGVLSEALKTEMVRRKVFLTEACRTARSFQGSLLLRDPGAEYRDAPLTYAQERIWMLERFHTGNAAYNIPEVFEITTSLDVRVLQQAVDHLVKRHESLRTKIIEDREQVVQRVCSGVTITVSVVQLCMEPTEDCAASLKARLQQESRRPFDLATAPLARIYLYILPDHRHFLLINLHHIIADRSSTSIFYRELLHAYTAFEQGRTPDLRPLPIQYSDYAIWERQLSASRLEPQLAYWQQRLSHLPEPLPLPFTRASQPVSSLEGAVHSFKLTEQGTAQLRSLAKQQGASLYMLLLTAYCALLNRYTGATDICVGSPVSERSFRETEPLIGLFVNTLVMRCRIPEQAGFLDLLASVRDTVLDAHANRDVPFQRVLTAVARDHAGSSQNGGLPLFRCMLAFDPLETASSATGRTTIELDPGFAKFDLTLQMKEESKCISGWFEYRKDVACQESIQRFALGFSRLLGDMLSSPLKPVEDFEILSPGDRQLLEAWNDTAVPFPVEHTIHRLFTEQAERAPRAVAVIDGHRRFTYEQLDRASDCVARLLLDAGVQTESIVGVQLPRTAEMIAALLGILKSGAAYLPVDENCPSARIQSMLEESSCRFMLTHPAGADRAFAPVQVLHLPDLFSISQQERVRTNVAPGNLAYVIYTSGSTGAPKGVAIEHRSVVSFLTWAKSHFSAEQLRGTLASTSISFDLSVFEIYLPLTTGGTVILAKDILALTELPSCREVTLATTVPSAAAALVDAGLFPPSLKHLNLAGEALTDDLLEKLYAQTGLLQIHDLYGPTETTTYSTCALRQRGQTATIGRPIANTRIYLLDDSLRLVQIGMVGELFIAGEGVARGYLNQPELSNERFITLAHLGEPSRAYRTGDMCRYNPDGTLVFLGRRDDQVKVNGFRIELGEIEAVLRHHPSVEEAVVIRLTAAGATVLAAAVRMNASTVDISALITHQSSLLPPHMVVRRLAHVDVFPLTPNGKIDRRQLAAQLAPLQPSAGQTAPAGNRLEQELLMIWQKGFGDSTIGIDDDFFQIGGNSLLALRIFSDIEGILKRRMTLSVLFRAPTVRRLAHQMGGAKTFPS